MKLFFDTETNRKADFRAGHDAPQQPHIAQLGALLTGDDGAEVASMDVLIEPDGWEMEAEAAAINGLTTEKLKACGIPITSALSVFSNLLRKADEIVAHNISFDLLVSRASYHRISKCEVFDAILEAKLRYCTMQKSTGICRLPQNGRGGFKWPKLTEAYFHFFKQEIIGAHSAMADVRACAAIYFAIKKL